MKKIIWNDEIISIEVVSGVEGPSLYINQYRIVGNKPWGGGKVLQSWKIKAKELRQFLYAAGIFEQDHTAREGEKEKE